MHEKQNNRRPWWHGSRSIPKPISQTKYGAVQDSDYPPIHIYSLPMEGFDETGIKDEELVKKQLIEGVKVLEKADSDLIIIACNTVHIFYKEMQEAVNIPIFNIVEKTFKKVNEHKYEKVGILGSESTINLKLYEDYFNNKGIETISPDRDQQKVLNSIIERVMGAHQGTEDIILLKDIIRDFVKKGAEAIILGCTELPLAINQTHTDVKLFDTIEIIVHSAVDHSLGR